MKWCFDVIYNIVLDDWKSERLWKAFLSFYHFIHLEGHAWLTSLSGSSGPFEAFNNLQVLQLDISLYTNIKSKLNNWYCKCLHCVHLHNGWSSVIPSSLTGKYWFQHWKYKLPDGNVYQEILSLGSVSGNTLRGECIEKYCPKGVYQKYSPKGVY